MNDEPIRKKPRETWADYLFRRVESSQGSAYISDGILPGSRERVMDIARAAKAAHYEAIAAINDFLIEASQHPKKLRKRRHRLAQDLRQERP